MSTLYFDCSHGLSGPMIVGALCDLGAKPSALEWDLSQIDLGEFHPHFERVTVGGLSGVRFSIHAGSVHTPDQDEHSSHGHEHHHHEQVHGGTHDHDYHSEAPHSVKNLIASVGASLLNDSVKTRVTSVLARLGQTHDALTLEEAAAVICAAGALDALKPERVAFFCREGTMDATVDSGASFAAEFVSSSAPLPAINFKGIGVGFGREGQSMRALIGELPS